jgi:hypothetical protein
MEEPEDLRRATELWQEASYRNQMDGELERAMEDYSSPSKSAPPRRRTPLWAGP